MARLRSRRAHGDSGPRKTTNGYWAIDVELDRQRFINEVARMVADRANEARQWEQLAKHWNEVANKQRAELDALRAEVAALRAQVEATQ